MVFQTNHGPDAPPIFQCQYEDFERSLEILRNLLGPDAILRDHPTLEVEVGEPIGQGLRSIVRITNGSITFDSNTLGLRPFIGLTMAITEGSIERNPNGKLEAHIETLVPFQSLQRLNEKLGLHTIQVISEDTTLSNDGSMQTFFSGETQHILPKGERTLDLHSWQEVPIPMNMVVRTQTTANGVLDGHIFSGHFHALLHYINVPLSIGLEGSFRVHLA